MSAPVEDVLADRTRWTVLHGDLRDVLPLLPDESIDSCVTDVPYELGFMAKSWDRSGIAFDPATYRQVFRVLKPGAHMLIFGGTRTYHRIACAIEDAGFEIRDSIGVFSWLYASGFPKSLSISLAIDKADGVDHLREVVHRYTAGGNAGTPTSEKGGTYVTGAPNSPPIELSVSRGATDKSRAFDGWGSALKPSWEPVIVARKPVKGTLIANALEFGTGGLNIDACRVATDWNEPDRPDSWKRSGNSEKPDAEKIAAPAGNGIECHPGGRWPPNCVFSHHPECKRVGPKRIRGTNPSGRGSRGETDNAIGFGGSPGKSRKASLYSDPNEYGVETVAAYSCVPSCPVRVLDEQSGESKSTGGGGAGKPGIANGDGIYGKFGKRDLPANVGKGDSGTGSRFFPQFEIDPETLFMYCAKAARSERELGCEKLPARTGAVAVGRKDGSAGARNARAGAGRAAESVRNCHPTVKPVGLIRYLVRLVTPKNGVCLDFTCGSGTTGVACVEEDFRFIGIELNDTDEEPYVRIARARIGYHAQAGVQLSLLGGAA